jgi:hypothetical protein
LNTYVPVLDLLVFVVLLWSARFVLSSTQVEPWVKNLNAVQTIITILAVVIAGSWYVVEQPHATKLKIDQTAAGAPGPPGQVMVVAEVTLTNLGSTVLSFRDAPLKLFVQQVSPTPPGVLPELGRRDAQGALIISEGDNWGTIAQARGKVVSFLEQGESDNYYYRVAIPCQPGLRVYFTSRLARPPMITDILFKVKDYQFIKQTLVDLSDLCAQKQKSPL